MYAFPNLIVFWFQGVFPQTLVFNTKDASLFRNHHPVIFNTVVTIVAGHNSSGEAPPNWPTKPCLAETTTRPLSKGNPGKTRGTAYDPAKNSSGEAPPEPPTQTCRFLPDLTGNN